MRKVINISIPEPCHEDWSKMTPEEKGRHCSLCKKTVFDFTAKTDEYIVETFTENKNLCGRFKSTQLQRDLVFSRKEKNSYLSFVASGLFAFLGLSSQPVYSQGEPIKTDIIQHNAIKGKVAPPTQKNRNSISGVITGEDKSPLPGANIIIKGTKNGTSTNFDGEFSIDAKEDDILQINYLGFKSKEVKITDNLSKIVLIELKEDLMGEMVVVLGGATSCNVPYQLTPEVLEKKAKQIEFARMNGNTFYKRKKKEHRDKIRNGEVERSGFGKMYYKILNIFSKKQ